MCVKCLTLPVTRIRFSSRAVAAINVSISPIGFPFLSSIQRISPYFLKALVGYCSKRFISILTSSKCSSFPDLYAPKYNSANVMSEILQSSTPACLMFFTTQGLFLISAIQVQVSSKYLPCVNILNCYCHTSTSFLVSTFCRNSFAISMGFLSPPHSLWKSANASSSFLSDSSFHTPT